MDVERARQLAQSLISQHGLRDWRFTFDRAKRRFGCCNYQTKTISLSLELTQLNSEGEVTDTLLHEIAHALTPGDAHGSKWRACCRRIGARPQRCYRSNVAQPPPKYLLECPTCKLQVPRLRRSSRTLYCRRCCEQASALSEAFRLRLKPLTAAS